MYTTGNERRLLSTVPRNRFVAKSTKSSLKCTFNCITFIWATASFFMCFRIIDAAPSEANVCQSESCRSIATSIKQKMDSSVDPCDNFYKFVCGNFSRNAEIPPSKSSINLFEQLEDVVHSQLKNNIENQITREDPIAFHKLYHYYKYCMDEERIEKSGRKMFQFYLNKFGGWPVLLGNWYDDSQFDWKDTTRKISRVGYSWEQIVGAYVDVDAKNNTRSLIHLGQANLGIAQEYLSEGLENEYVRAYFKYMVDVAEIFGADRKQAELELGESLNFEIELAKISLSAFEWEDETKRYNPMKISEFQNKYPYISWLKYLNDLLKSHYVLTEDEVIIVTEPSFFERLNDVLARTPKRVLANYLMWRVVLESADYLDKEIRDAQLEFRAFFTGNKNTVPRWQTCIDFASRDLHLAVSALYVRRNFNTAARNGATDMVNRLRRSFGGILSEVDWMDETTRSAAMQKLEQMVALVAYFDESLDDEKIDDYYRDLKLCPKSFLTTVLRCSRYASFKQVNKLRKSVARVDWTDPEYASYIVDAYYNSVGNIIQFPAAGLQGELYSEDNPKYINYAAMGSVIGHEIIHGFDDQGSNFDSTGNLVYWWTPNTEEEYLKRAECVVDQYTDIIDPEIGYRIDGHITQSENIADSGGLKQAYLAYADFEAENGEEPPLPGFENFTPRQHFWLSYGNMLCTKYTKEYPWMLIVWTEGVSPNRVRLIGTIVNSPDFAKDFNCPVGSPMNPEKKCTIW